jgi:KDO2-lipid IV(A) lauroyltransferase
MKKIGFWLYYPVLKFLSILPIGFLYIISDVLYWFIYKIFKYRRKVVYYNLKLSFPTLGEKEIFIISENFYRHLCDLIVESVKAFSITKKEILSKVSLPTDFVEKDFGANRSVLLLLGHFGNWEWAGMASSAITPFKIHIVYHTLSNEYFDLLMQKTRSKFGAILSPMEQTIRTLIKHKDQAVATCLVADQNPVPETAYWADFLGRKTAFFKGPAKIAQKLNMPLYYVSVTKSKRGFYELNPMLLVKNPNEYSEEEIMDKYIQKLEEDIEKTPHLWLWSHRRWKHSFEKHEAKIKTQD